jgi:hypothetical protein
MERRSADRVRDDSRLVVTGFDRSGGAFEEISLIRDVSPGGISFLLQACIEPGTVVGLSICSGDGVETQFLPKFQTQARVLRVLREVNGGNLFMVAARFEGEIMNFAADDSFEAMARELQKAVAYDESQRHQFE